MLATVFSWPHLFDAFVYGMAGRDLADVVDRGPPSPAALSRRCTSGVAIEVGEIAVDHGHGTGDVGAGLLRGCCGCQGWRRPQWAAKVQGANGLG